MTDSEENGSSVFEANTDEKATSELISIIKEFLNIDINYE